MSSSTSVYAKSPVAVHERAVTTAAALMVLQVTRETIGAELMIKFGYTESEARKVLRAARRRMPPTIVRPAPRMGGSPDAL